MKLRSLATKGPVGRLDLTALEASAGDSHAAWAHPRQALSSARAPELVRDMLRARPELQVVIDEPA